MKIHDCIQGTDEWLRLRKGLPTASNFHKIITPKKGDLSKQARSYAFLLIAEKLLNETFESLRELDWIARGKDLEPDAIRMYEFDQEIETTQIGFITDDEVTIGCSPDRLVGDKGLLEIKCPSPPNHISYMIDGFGEDYMCQAQGQLYISGREWCDRVSYHPLLPPYRQRTFRDEPYIDKLAAALKEFVAMKDEMLQRIRATGYFEERERLITATERELAPEILEYTH